MKVVAYMLMVLLEVLTVFGWSLLTDGMTLIVGSIVIGLAFGWLLVRAANFKEDAQ